MIDAVDRVFGQLHLAFAHQRRDFGPRFGEAGGVVGDDEALHRGIAFGELEVVFRPAHVGKVRILGDRAADRDARVCRSEVCERDIEDLATDVVEEHVDAAGRGSGHFGGDIGVLVVDGDIGAELFLEIAALVRPAGNADDPAAARLGQLHHHRAHRPRRTGDQHRIARLDFRDRDQADPRGEAGGETERADIIARLYAVREVELGERGGRRQRMGLRGEHAKHPIADREPFPAPFHDLADTERAYGRAERCSVVEAAGGERGADPCVHRQRIDFHDDVAGGHIGDLQILDPEVLERRHPFTVLPDEYAAIGVRHGALRPS